MFIIKRSDLFQLESISQTKGTPCSKLDGKYLKQNHYQLMDDFPLKLLTIYKPYFWSQFTPPLFGLKKSENDHGGVAGQEDEYVPGSVEIRKPHTWPQGTENTIVDPTDNCQNPKQDTSPPCIWSFEGLFTFIKVFPRLKTVWSTSLFNFWIMRNIVGNPRVISTKAFTTWKYFSTPETEIFFLPVVRSRVELRWLSGRSRVSWILSVLPRLRSISVRPPLETCKGDWSVSMQ